jgi:hypothetical protein
MATACAAGLSLVSNGYGQTTQPVQINDVLYGLNRANPAETVQHIRGDPTPVNGGQKVGSTWNAGSIQFLQFDNLDGFRHAYDGNLLAGDFGSTANGFKLYNLETRRTPGATTPGNSQPLFDFASYNAANPTNPLTVARGAGLSVSPQNNRIAVTGVDASLNGLFYVLDYSAGVTPGTGAGASVSNGRQLSGVVQNGSASNTTATVWLDNDNILTLNHPANGGASTGTLKKVTVGTGGALSASDVATVTFGAGTAAFSSMAYEPELSPYVYLGFSQFSGSTINRLLVLDPNNNFATVGSFDYSTSMNTGREIGFDSKGNLFWSEFGNTTSVPLGGSIDRILGANILSNLANNNSAKYYTQDQSAALSAQFSGIDVAAALLDYKTPGVTSDVRSKSVTVRYFPGTVEDPKDQIRQRLFTGRNGGNWNGTGSAIVSSTAAANATRNTGIGYAEASELNLIGQQWGGVTVDGPAIVMKYTYYGDTDLNGKVNFDDYVRTDNGFNNHLTGWTNGDFDYNNVVNFDDYVLIDLAFNTQSGTLGRALSFLDGSDPSSKGMNDPALQKIKDHLDEFGGDYAQHFLSAVPEPASLALASLVTSVTMLARRRLRRRAS